MSPCPHENAIPWCQACGQPVDRDWGCFACGEGYFGTLFCEDCGMERADDGSEWETW